MAKKQVGDRETATRGGLKTPTSSIGIDRRAQMIDAAATLFRTQGYDATSLQDLADAVGIQKGSIYHYIETKEDILFAIIESVHMSTESGNVAWQDATGSLNRIRSFVEGHLRVSIANLEYTEVFFRDNRALSPARQAQIVEARDRYEGALRGLIEQAKKEGRTRRNLDPGLATRVMFGMMNWIYYWYRADGPKSVDDLVSEIADFALASLSSTSTRTPGR